MRNFISRHGCNIYAAVIIAVFFLMLSKCVAQDLGFNGAGFFENYNPVADPWLEEIAPFTLRLPGGAISKFADPYNTRNGWGMTEASIQNWFARSSQDENGEGLDKWLRKLTDQPSGRSYMDDLITFQHNHPSTKIIWVLNVLNLSPEDNMNALRYMIAGGVNIVAVEAGNEVYGLYGAKEAYAAHKTDTSFAEYQKDFEPIFQMISSEFPYIKKSLCIAPFTRKEFVKWNNDLQAYQGSYEMATVHFYLGEQEIPDSYALLPERKIINYSAPDPELDTCFKQFAYDIGINTDFDSTIDMALQKYPGKEIIVTEFNTNPASAFCNTLAQADWIFHVFTSQRDRIKYLCIHNGIGPEGYPIIGSKLKQDISAAPLIRRAAYFSFLAAQALYDETQFATDTLDQFFTFDNLLGPDYIPQYVWEDLILDSVRVIYLTGQYLYSSAGAIGLMSNQQPPVTPEITTLYQSNENLIPAQSFGYFAYYLSKPKPPVDTCNPPEKCKRLFYSIFHPKKCNCKN